MVEFEETIDPFYTLLLKIMYSSRKYPYSPHRRDWNFLGGSVRPKTLKKCMELNWNFQKGGGGGVLQKFPSMGELWIFSGITQCRFESKFPILHSCYLMKISQVLF